MKAILIREATVADVEAIAHVHVDCWREAYAKILPAEYLSALSWQKRAENWQKRFQEAQVPWKAFVAEETGVIKGFACSGISQKSDLGIAGELSVLYLLKQAQGCGLGRKLFEKARNNLVIGGINGMYLWVFKDNPARAFYEHMGGREIARQSVNIGGAEIEEVALVWQ